MTKDTREGAETSITKLSEQLDTSLQLNEEIPQEKPREDALLSSRKHVFILSNAGKPIYSRYGDEQQLAPLMGIIQAIISFSQSATGYHDSHDCIRSIATAKRKFVFLLRNELYFLVVAKTGEPEPYLKLQLEYLYHQILLVLTGNRIQRAFSSNPSYDLRGLLCATHNVLSGVVDMSSPSNTESSACLLTSSISPLPLQHLVRHEISQSIIRICGSVPNLLYAILFMGNRVVTIVQPQASTFHLYASDVLLLLNFVNTQTSFRGVESWVPVCLPRFNDSGFLYAYIACLQEKEEEEEGGDNKLGSSNRQKSEKDIFLLLISATDDPEQFKASCQCRQEIGRTIREQGWFEALWEGQGAQGSSKALSCYSHAAMAFHFIYKYSPSFRRSKTQRKGSSTTTTSSSSAIPSQCISSGFFFPYIDEQARQSVWNRYATGFLRLRYGGQSQWVHAGCSTDRWIHVGGGKKRDGEEEEEEEGGLETSTASRKVEEEEGEGACMMDLFEREAKHSLVYEIRETDALVVSIGPDYEVYALLSSACDSREVGQAVSRLIRAIKKDEHRMFMTDAYYW